MLLEKCGLQLSDREVQCLYYTIKGESAALIGEKLHISKRTVEEYLSKLKIKFEVKNKYELIYKAIESDFLKISSELFKNIV